MAASDPKQDLPLDRRPMLFFFTARTSGPARRMQSLVAWLEVTRKAWLRIVVVDVDRHPTIAERFAVEAVPTIVLVVEGRQVGRIAGRTNSQGITRLLEPYAPPVDAADG